MIEYLDSRFAPEWLWADKGLKKGQSFLAWWIQVFLCTPVSKDSRGHGSGLHQHYSTSANRDPLGEACCQHRSARRVLRSTSINMWPTSLGIAITSLGIPVPSLGIAITSINIAQQRPSLSFVFYRIKGLHRIDTPQHRVTDDRYALTGRRPLGSWRRSRLTWITRAYFAVHSG